MDIVNIISSVGFPIACCVAMGYYVKYITDENRNQLEKFRVENKEEIKILSESLNNNTLAIIKLCERIDNEKGGLDERV